MVKTPLFGSGEESSILSGAILKVLIVFKIENILMLLAVVILGDAIHYHLADRLMPVKTKVELSPQQEELQEKILDTNKRYRVCILTLESYPNADTAYLEQFKNESEQLILEMERLFEEYERL